MFKCNRFLESSYAIYFMYLKALFWKGVYGLFTRLPKVSMAPGYPLLTVPRKALWKDWRWEIQGECLTHTHTHTHYPWSSLTQGGLCPGTRAPLAARFSEHLQEWKPLLTRSKTPLRLSQRNTIYYQHVFSFSMFQGDALKRSAYMNI